MAKLKKYHLELEHEIDFDIIGICSHHNDYRLAWSINASLGFHFEQLSEAYQLVHVKKGQKLKTMHTMFEFHDIENHLCYTLIKNKADGKFLIPEKPSIDFFLLIRDREMINLESFCSKLRMVSSVVAVFPFEPEELNSIENIIL